MIRIHDRDPLAILLVRVLKLSTTKVILLVLLSISFVDGIVLNWIDGMLRWPINWPWLLTQCFWFFIVIPTVYGYYRWSIDDIPLLFETLASNDVIRRARRGEERAFFDQLRRSFNDPVWVALSTAIALGLLAFVNNWVWKEHPEPWLDVGNRYHWLFAQVAMIINGYVGATVAVRELLTIEWIRRFFRDFEIRILPQPQHRAGGFGVIGHHYSWLTTFVVAIGVAIAISRLFFTVTSGHLTWAPLTGKLVAAYVAYLLVSLVSFFLPSWIAHRSMDAEKQRVLGNISSAYERQSRRLSDGIGATARNINRTVQVLQSWRNAYDLTMTSLPTWPWETRVLGRVLATIVTATPIALGIASIILRITSST